MATNVDFYEKIKDVQEFQHNSESKRLELEKQLNQYMKSDHRLARLKAVRLQNYWKKLCEDEKRSEWRNEQLLKDIERVENQMVSLSARTDRLKTMKRQYEEYIERVYPQWKEKVLAYQEIKKQQAQMNVEKYAAAAMALQQGSAMPGTGFPATSTRLGTVQGMGQQAMADLQSSVLQQPLEQQLLVDQVNQQKLLNQQLLQQQQQQLLYQQQNTTQQLGVPQIKVMGPSGVGGGTFGVSPGSTMQTVSDLPTGYSLTSNVQQQQNQHQQVSFSTMESTAFSTGEYGVPPEGYEDSPATPEPDFQSDHSTSPKVTAVQHNIPQVPETPRDEDTWRTEEPTPRTPRDEPVAGGSVPRYANVPPPPDDDFADTSEFASDVELPEEYNERSQPTPRSRESVEHNVVSRQSSGGSQGRLSRQQSAEMDKPVYPQADVTLEGLYNLLSAVQDTFAGAFSPEEYYRDQLPPMSVRKDVISNANRGCHSGPHWW